MNKIFKVKKNRAGESVVTSELAKSHSVTAVAKALMLSLLAGSAFAVPVSMQGTATSENAVAIGSNSYSTAVNGVASGNGAIATGRNFSKADFATKQRENAAAIANAAQAQTTVDHTRNLISSSNEAIGGINREIAELTKAQQRIQGKLDQKRNLEGQANNLTGTLGSQKTALEQAKNALDAIKRDGQNKYINFTDILKTLNWAGELNGGDAGRNRLAQSLKTIVDRDFPDFASRYTLPQYRGIIDGYFNRIATYQGSIEGLSTPEYLGSSFYSDNGFGEWSFFANEKLDVTYTGGDEGYKDILNVSYFNTRLDTIETKYIKLDNAFKYDFEDGTAYLSSGSLSSGPKGISKSGKIIGLKGSIQSKKPIRCVVI